MAGEDALLPFLYFLPLPADGRMLVVTDRPERRALHTGLLAREIHFAAPGGACGEGYHAVVVDVAAGDPADWGRRLLGTLRPEGALLLLDWRTRALRGALRLLRGAAPSPVGDRPCAWEFLLEPSLARPRFLVRPGFRSAIPAEYGPGWRRALKRRGLFYLQPRQRAAVFAPPGARDLAGDACEEALGERRPDLRRIYVSDTGMLVLEARASGGTAYLRFPFDARARERLARAHALVSLVRGHGFGLAPEPLAFHPDGPCPRHAERAVPGVPAPATPAALEAALAAALDLHLRGAERVTLDEAGFQRHLGPPLALLAERLGPRVERVGARLRDGLLGRKVLVSACHGDFKLGNCLFEAGRVSGLVDWDLGSPAGLTLVDPLNLHARHAQAERSLPEVVADADAVLAAPTWPAYFAATDTTPVAPATGLLLWWVDRASKQLRDGGDPDGRWAARHALPLLDQF